MIEGHGDDLYHFDGKVKLNFSSNIIQGIKHTGLKKHIASHLDSIFNYPEAAPFSVEELIADKLRLSKHQIMVTNGATESIHLIARVFKCSQSAILQPTFAEYADACRISDHSLSYFYNIEDIPTEAQLIWICNPNNPTGKVWDSKLLKSIILQNPEKIFIIDQAYHKYTKQEIFSPDEINNLDNLILLYSMTKDYAIPGLRIGYIITNRNIIKRLKEFRIPWSINAIAIEAAKYLLSSKDLEIDQDILLNEVKRVSTKLRKLNILVEPSDTNFLLCKLENGTSAHLKTYLIENHGVLIRDASNFEGLSAKHFRIAVQNPENDNLLISAIQQWMQS